MRNRRREPPDGWPDGIETVPLRDQAEEAPAAARDGVHVSRPPQGIPARAWIVQRQSGAALVDAEAIAWTSRQVQVRYFDQHGRQGWAWLWTSAVNRRPD